MKLDGKFHSSKKGLKFYLSKKGIKFHLFEQMFSNSICLKKMSKKRVLNSICLKKGLILFIMDTCKQESLANSEDPDEMLHTAAFHQNLHCLQR